MFLARFRQTWKHVCFPLPGRATSARRARRVQQAQLAQRVQRVSPELLARLERQDQQDRKGRRARLVLPGRQVPLARRACKVMRVG